MLELCSQNTVLTLGLLIFFGLFVHFQHLFIQWVRHSLKKEVLKMQKKRKILANPNNSGSKIFVMFLLRNAYPHLVFSFTNKNVMGV